MPGPGSSGPGASGKLYPVPTYGHLGRSRVFFSWTVLSLAGEFGSLPLVAHLGFNWGQVGQPAATDSATHVVIEHPSELVDCVPALFP